MCAWFRKRRAAQVAIDDADWRSACEDIELTSRLSGDSVARLRDCVGHFLQHKRISGAAGLSLDSDDHLRIAILACLPVIGLGPDWLRGWSEVIVYPGQFRVRREEHDEESGIVSESHDWLAGEAWQQGPLILSLDDIRQDLDDPFSGNNLVAHEVAHKLDMLDGHVDGIPPLPDRDRHQRWQAVFQREFDSFRAAVDADEDTALDPYASESPDEFFAVTSEVYFSAPELLRQFHPAIHEELRQFYGVELLD